MKLKCLPIAVFATLAVSATGCSGASFEVGDCVQLDERVLDYDLDAVDCDTPQEGFDPSTMVYRVDSIIENTDGGCPQLQGFFPVEFVHEPDGVTYCLVART